MMMMMMDYYDRGRFLVDLDGTLAGAEGTIIITYNDGEAFCVEIVCEGRLIDALPRKLEININITWSW